MEIPVKLARHFAKFRFRMLGLATIKDIPTDDFRVLIEKLIAAGWRKQGEYEGFDAWIDYGAITLRRNSRKLSLEWDNWTEGSIEGPRGIVEEIGRQFGLPVTYEWRWAAYDSAHRPKPKR